MSAMQLLWLCLWAILSGGLVAKQEATMAICAVWQFSPNGREQVWFSHFSELQRPRFGCAVADV
jgi:hypothetical protein